MKEYDLKLNGETVGKVDVSRQGLYYEIFCRCDLRLDASYKLVARGSKGESRLGGFVPANGSLCLRTRIPVSRIGEGEISFRTENYDSYCRIILKEDQPLDCLDQLINAHLETIDGQKFLAYPSIDNSTGQ